MIEVKKKITGLINRVPWMVIFFFLALNKNQW